MARHGALARFVRLLVLAAPVPCLAAPVLAVPVVTVLGDSITAGYGLAANQALPAQLQAALAKHGMMADVRAAGVSGDTAEGGLARVNFSVAPDTTLCVIELGANDYLQSVPPDETKTSLLGIVRALKTRHIKVVLLGGVAPKRTAGSYAHPFDAMFPDIARAEDVVLDPDFLAGVEDHPELKQSDGMHPNAAGAHAMAEKIAPYVIEALRQPPSPALVAPAGTE